MGIECLKESKMVDYIMSLGFDVIKEKVKDEREAKMLRDRLKDFVDRQQKINWNCTKDEEIDFEGLFDYLQTNLLEDVQLRLFGNREERRMARKTIIEKAVYYSQAHTNLSKKRVISMTFAIIDILADFYKSKINRELKFITAQIEDVVTEVVEEHEKVLSGTIHSVQDNILKAIDEKFEKIESLSVEKNKLLMKNGEIGQVEDVLSNWLNEMESTHILFPNYCYEYKRELKQFYSKPLTQEAIKKYPPRLYCTGTIQMNGKCLEKLDIETIDYANRHQLPITLNVITAKKLLGNIDDPIQHEAEKLIGESIIIQPEPFPPAFPCSISMDGDVMFDYILFRTEEILDDGTIIISNREQEGCPFRIKLSINIQQKKTIYSLDIVEAKNKDVLHYLKVLMRAAHGNIISIKALSLGEELASGQLGNVKYQGNLDKIETEIEFLEKIVAIEHYYTDVISLPEAIMMEDYKGISYLSSLIDGKECTGSWNKLDISMTLTEELKKHLLDEDDKTFALSYVGEVTVSFYGKSYKLLVVRKFDSVIYKDIEHLKRKAEILDVGDIIKLSFLPGDGVSGIWRDCLDNSND